MNSVASLFLGRYVITQFDDHQVEILEWLELEAIVKRKKKEADTLYHARKRGAKKLREEIDILESRMGVLALRHMQGFIDEVKKAMGKEEAELNQLLTGGQ